MGRRSGLHRPHPASGSDREAAAERAFEQAVRALDGGDRRHALGFAQDALAGADANAALCCDLGDLFTEAGAPRLAAKAFAAAIAADPTLADAHHGLGNAKEALGDFPGMVKAYLETRRLDAEDEPPPWHLSEDEMAACAEAALDQLPDRAKALIENVPVLLDDAPSEELIREGVDPRVCGLFFGLPLTDKSHLGQGPSIDAIYIYQRNLERMCDGPDQLADEIAITVLHETAHYFGLDDEDLGAIGLG